MSARTLAAAIVACVLVAASVRAVEPPVVSGVEPPVVSGIEPPVVSGVEPPVVSGVEPPVVSGVEPPVVSAVEPLRVCSDPNNLPFSNQAEQGFENRIASLIARDQGTRVEYTWWAERRAFLRHTLNAGRCDVVMGFASGAGPAATTVPYYRSTYVFLTRRSAHLHVHSLDDPVLHTLRVGVQLVGDDGANSPPAHALSRRGIVRNVVGYTVYGDYRTPNPASAIVTAVARGDVDVAAVWGPLAGFFAARETVPLDLVPVTPRMDGALPEVFAISMAVRRRDAKRLRMLNHFIATHQREIATILREYHVPLVQE